MPQANATSSSDRKHGPSPIRWAGSKRHVISGLSEFIGKSKRHYVEPFAGSAAIFFGAQPHSATLGDANSALINFYKQLRRAPKLLHKSMCRIEQNPETYYAIRESFNNKHISNFEKATYFSYLNRNCFNGIWRTNLKGQFNVPFSSNSRSAYPTEAHFSAAAKTLKGVNIKCSDFRKTLRSIDYEGALIFADPPYFSNSDRVFVEYGSESFCEADLTELICLLQVAHEHGSIVILTYAYNEELLAEFPNWYSRTLNVTRNVGGFAGSRKEASEIVISNSSAALASLSR